MTEKSYRLHGAEIEGERVLLRPITPEDTPLIVKWRNTESVRRNFIFRGPFTAEVHTRWMETKVASGEVLQYIIVDKETGESVGNVFVRVTGKLERSDRGSQIICQDIQAMELSDRTNKPKIFEVYLTPRLLSYERMQSLSSIFARYGGMDRVELLVTDASGTTMRMELPTRVDARSVLLKAEVIDLVGTEGHVSCV